MRWLLDTSPEPVRPPARLDPAQQRVVDHRGGPLLVLAGPGTGKTTTIVEAIAARLTVDGLGPENVLALTFGRKAARELRDRLVARLYGDAAGALAGGSVPTVATFHSFAYSLLRATDPPDEFCEPPRLMSGAEEDARIRDLLLGAVEDGSIEWPEDLAAALPTLGLANEVRAVLSRARELDLSGPELQRIGEQSGRPAWAALGRLAHQEQQVMLMENVMDYTELLSLARNRALESQVQAMLHARFQAVYVDEYQDTDPLQVSFLRALVGPAATVVAVGDPDQAIYAFRGADVGGLLAFPDTFRYPDGRPADVDVLDSTRRFGPVIRTAAAAVFRDRLPVGLPVEQARRHRSPACQSRENDFVTVRIFDSLGGQAAHTAREIRMAHVQREVPWRELAVIVRSGHQIPVVLRALAAAGVPVVVANDEIPLRSEPAVAALLSVLRVAAQPGRVTSSELLDVLGGPVADLDPSDIRRLGRRLRSHVHRDGFATPDSASLLLDLVITGVEDLWAALDPADEATVKIRRFTDLVDAIHQQLTAGAPPETVLWTAWTGGRSPHGWPQRLRAAAIAGSRSAHHDLDAVMALFDAAERLSDRYPGFLGVRMFLDVIADQQIPAEAVAERGTRANAVRILTAHRAKGLEWDEVWVVGVQEGVWPDLRTRGTTLRAEELSRDGIGDGPRAADLLDEERRLFYVACTRARDHLHLSAVDENDAGGERPSRFLDDVERALADLGRPAREVITGRPPHPPTLDGLVAELRRVAADPTSSPVLAEAAVRRLALLAAERDDDGNPLVPAADPSQWWGIDELTSGVHPVRDPELPVALSGSSLDSMLDCPLSWFLAREARGEVQSGPATSFGKVVHAVADFVGKGVVPPTIDAVESEVDRVWEALRFEAAWQSRSERTQARESLERFLQYHVHSPRTLVDTEQSLQAEVAVPLPGGGSDAVHLRGFIDRLERDDEGRVVAVDLKTMRNAVREASLPENGQLGVYQQMLHERGEDVGGAALVQLRVPAGKGSSAPKVQDQPPLDTSESPTWVEIKLGEAAETIRTENFIAKPGSSCRYCAFTVACPAQVDGQQVSP